MAKNSNNAVIVIPCYANKDFVPVKAHDDDACYDLMARCYLDASEPDLPTGNLRLLPGRRCLAKTGVKLQLPKGYHAYILSRSGLAWKDGIQVLNAPGVIDKGYRAEIGVILYNAGGNGVDLKYGQRIAQLAIMKTRPTYLTMISEEEFKADTERGEGGFGSTGE
ncbi:MAG: dUTP diphosphatase [Oscillospiraceae bacterium]|nr:dUTP diphosphatase [Oscillospiraceae bacterium]